VHPKHTIKSGYFLQNDWLKSIKIMNINVFF
jgi:hypothetical protein